MNRPAVKAEHETGRSQEFDDQVAAALAFDDEDMLSRDYGVIQPEQLIVVRAYGDDSDDMLLSELRPRWVIMYDPNQDFLRRIEVCKSVAFGVPAISVVYPGLSCSSCRTCASGLLPKPS